MTESHLTRKILRLLNAQPRTKAIKIHGSPLQEAGTPDILCVSRGRVYLFEIKLPGNSPTRLQARRLREWRAAGATAVVCGSVEEVRQWIDAPPPSAGNNSGKRPCTPDRKPLESR